jgi:hypothetical protein
MMNIKATMKMNWYRHKNLFAVLSLWALVFSGCAPEKPKVFKGSLELDSIPQGASITVNSKTTIKKLTPLKLKLRPGTYLVKFHRDNYESVWRYVKIKAGSQQSLKIRLPEIKGAVLVTSEPLGAKVLMNGKNQGLTPLVMTDLKPGEYSARIEHLNRAPRVIKWKITDARPKKVSASLDSDIGRVVIKSNPSRARVYIDGKACGITPYRADLQEGRHNIKLTLAGFAEAKTTVDIMRDKQTSKTVTLVKLPGAFRFVSKPAGATVYINGRSFGKTPLKVDDMKAGKYKVSVEKSGFDSVSRDAYITAGRVNTVEFDLRRNTGGIDLIVNPPGVTVYVNGKKFGMTVKGASDDLSKVLHIRNLPAGKYQIMLAHKRMMPPTMRYRIKVNKGKITRPKPINVWIANAILKIRNEHQIKIRLLAKNEDSVIYSPEPGVKITIPKNEMGKIESIRPLTEEDL